MSTTYAVLLTGDEDRWAAADDAERAAGYAAHDRFSQLLAERGHEVVGGAELTHSRSTRTLRPDADGGHSVTDGPYAEVTEQLGGFYLVRSDDLDGLLETCAALSRTGDAIEVRPCVDHGDDG